MRLIQILSLLILSVFANTAMATLYEVVPPAPGVWGGTRVFFQLRISDGFDEFGNIELSPWNFFGSSERCEGCQWDGQMLMDTGMEGILDPKLVVETISIALGSYVYDFEIDAPALTVVATIEIDYFTLVLSRPDGSPIEQLPANEEVISSVPGFFWAAGRVVIDGTPIPFVADAIVIPAINIFLTWTPATSIVAFNNGNSKVSDWIHLGAFGGLEYDMRIGMNFGPEDFLEAPGATIVPEPSSSLLMLSSIVSLLGLAGWRRLRA